MTKKRRRRTPQGSEIRESVGIIRSCIRRGKCLGVSIDFRIQSYFDFATRNELEMAERDLQNSIGKVIGILYDEHGVIGIREIADDHFRDRHAVPLQEATR
ncbi:MAG: hypothetical protein ACLPY5_06320 [Candidatus Bathyarchaeia archaeon]